MQQDVIGFESGVSFEFPTPVAVFMLLSEEKLACAIYGSRNTAGEIFDLPEAQLRRCGIRGRGGGLVLNKISCVFSSQAPRSELPQSPEQSPEADRNARSPA